MTIPGTRIVTQTRTWPLINFQFNPQNYNLTNEILLNNKKTERLTLISCRESDTEQTKIIHITP